MILALYDGEKKKDADLVVGGVVCYGLIDIKMEDMVRVQEVLDKYRDEDEAYNIEDFYSVLKDAGIQFKDVTPNPDEFMYF